MPQPNTRYRNRMGHDLMRAVTSDYGRKGYGQGPSAFYGKNRLEQPPDHRLSRPAHLGSVDDYAKPQLDEGGAHQANSMQQSMDHQAKIQDPRTD